MNPFKIVIATSAILFIGATNSAHAFSTCGASPLNVCMFGEDRLDCQIRQLSELQSYNHCQQMEKIHDTLRWSDWNQSLQY